MIIDQYLSTYQFSEYHEMEIARSVEKVYPLILSTPFTRSNIIRWLFAFRGLPRKMDSVGGFIESGFIKLEEKQNEELVLGFLFGASGLRAVSPSVFKRFDENNHVKGVWNFRVQSRGEKSIASTETRVHCLGGIARTLFALYWFPVSRFSGLIRREMLRLIKQEAEK